MENLTSLTNVKAWAGVTTANDDELLNRLISNASRFILSYLQRRTLLYFSNTEILDGVNNTRLYPKYFPILSVSSLTIDGQPISMLATGDTTNAGAILEIWDGRPPGLPQAISLRGYRFCKGLSNINLQYTSGYVIQKEPQTVPSSAQYSLTANQPYGNWAADNGVVYASTGVALTAVSPKNPPAQGQYAVTEGEYTFNSADAGQNLLITYSFIPSDIEEACIELVAERYRYKGRIGEVSKSLGGQQTAAYSQKSMPDFIREMLQPYKNIIL